MPFLDSLPEVKDLQLMKRLPDLMRFSDGRAVETPDQWWERRQEILKLFEKYMYGEMPDSSEEEIGYEISGGNEPKIREMSITVSRAGRRASFTVRVTLPLESSSGMACLIELCPFSWFGNPFVSPN